MLIFLFIKIFEIIDPKPEVTVIFITKNFFIFDRVLIKNLEFNGLIVERSKDQIANLFFLKLPIVFDNFIK